MLDEKFKLKRHDKILQIRCDKETLMKFRTKKIKFKNANDFIKYLLELYDTHNLYQEFYYMHTNNLYPNNYKYTTKIKIRCDEEVLIKYKETKARFKNGGVLIKYLLNQYIARFE
jgi:hypothetical protein